jgi:hypothetical protein
MRVLLLSADRYEVANEATGEILRGATLFYVNNYRDSSGEIFGLKPTKISASLEILNTIKKSGFTLPAYAELEIGTKPGARNKAALVCFDIEITQSIDLFPKK